MTALHNSTEGLLRTQSEQTLTTDIRMPACPHFREIIIREYEY